MQRLEEFKAKWKKQITKNEFPALFESMEQALNQESEAYNEYIIHHSNLNHYQREARKGVIDINEPIELKKIKSAIIGFIDQLTIDDLKLAQPQLLREPFEPAGQKKRTWLLTISLIFSLLIIGFVVKMVVNHVPKPSMVRIKGGTFEMGDVMKTGEATDEQVHTVTLDDFEMAKYELTNEEFDRFCKVTEIIRDKVHASLGKHPVVKVSWKDALAYCDWLSIQHGLEPVYEDPKSPHWDANGYRLPTEAEWEYAARQGGEKVLFGNKKDTADPKEINFKGSPSFKKRYSVVGAYREKTVPVGSLHSPNTLGLHDMSGNVWEWCWDWYNENYDNNRVVNPKGPDSGTEHVLRGGSYKSPPSNCRVSKRNKSNQTFTDIGFRLARKAK